MTMNRVSPYRKCVSTLVCLGVFLVPLFAGAQTFQNPLGNVTVVGLIDRILLIIVRVAAVVAVFCLIMAGFDFVTSGGKPDKIKEAKQWLWAVLIGGLISMGAFAIASVVKNTVCSIAPAACQNVQ